MLGWDVLAAGNQAWSNQVQKNKTRKAVTKLIKIQARSGRIYIFPFVKRNSSPFLVACDEDN